MKKIRLLVLLSFLSFLAISCGRFNPFDPTIDSSSDGSFVMETSLSDGDLLQQGFGVVYRFESVPHLVAVKPLPHFHPTHTYSAPNLVKLIMENQRKRSSLISNSASTSISATCSSAFCEAGFDKAIESIQRQSSNLKSVPMAVIDSGVLASTSAIEQRLNHSDNMTNDLNPDHWISHATMIASLFSGVMYTGISKPFDVYSPNGVINSVKINFSGDDDDSIHQKYGSMQLAVAMDKAVTLGAKVVNLSLTYTGQPDDNIAFAEQGLMAAAAKKGVIFIAAAGNDSQNNDEKPVYPAAYSANNLVVTGSHMYNLQRAYSSNYGNSVDISAQGASIFVNDKHGEFLSAGGTSFASPLVGAALSLYLGVSSQNVSVDTILHDLFSSALKDYAYEYENAPTSHYGRLNANDLVLRALSRNP